MSAPTFTAIWLVTDGTKVPALYDKKGGPRKNSGRPRGGVRDARNRIMKAFHCDGVDSCAQVVTDLVMEGDGRAVIKIWYEMGAHIPTNDKKKKNKKSVYIEALDGICQLEKESAARGKVNLPPDASTFVLAPTQAE